MLLSLSSCYTYLWENIRTCTGEIQDCKLESMHTPKAADRKVRPQLTKTSCVCIVAFLCFSAAL